MLDIPRWFDRRFDVPYPAALLPLVLTRLRGAPARLDEIMRSASRTARTARRDDTWSAQENAAHMLDLEPLWLARVRDYLSSHNELTPADLTNTSTTSADHNARPLDELLADFRAARATLVRRATAADASVLTTAIPHPRLGTPMTLSDHLHFVAEHDDHHLARIWQLVGEE